VIESDRIVKQLLTGDLRVCSTDDVDETAAHDSLDDIDPSDPWLNDTRVCAILPDWSARDALLSATDLCIRLGWGSLGLRNVYDLANLMDYEEWRVGWNKRGNGAGRRTRMDVEAMVGAWHEAIVALSTAHDPEAHNRAEHASDDLLGPILMAPIAQMREFTQRLAKALENDPRWSCAAPKATR
jgi:hypothetical protein